VAPAARVELTENFLVAEVFLVDLVKTQAFSEVPVVRVVRKQLFSSLVGLVEK